MYSKEYIKSNKILFYTSFGRYMGKNRSIYNKKIKWLNYPTNVKNIYIRLNVNNKIAAVYIDIQHKDEDIRSLFFDQFMELQTVFKSILGEKWNWEKETHNENGIACSRISTKIENVNIFEKNTWQNIFKFFEYNLLNFDEFWNEFNEVFKQLED